MTKPAQNNPMWAEITREDLDMTDQSIDVSQFEGSSDACEHKSTIQDRMRWARQNFSHRIVSRYRLACSWLMWLGHKPTSMEVWAEKELRRAGWFKEDGFHGDMMGHATMRMIREFCAEGHSGMSAGISVGVFSALARYEPLTPLTGEDAEWGEAYDHDGTQQNLRCSHVFRRPDGTAYDINGKVFREPNRCSYTSSDSRVDIKFPYTPKTEYVDVPFGDGITCEHCNSDLSGLMGHECEGTQNDQS